MRRDTGVTYRIFNVTASDGLTVSNGSAATGQEVGGLANPGGGIVTVNECAFTQNQATNGPSEALQFIESTEYRQRFFGALGGNQQSAVEGVDAAP